MILAMFNLSSANAFNLVMSKILLFGKELKTAGILELPTIVVEGEAPLTGVFLALEPNNLT